MRAIAAALLAICVAVPAVALAADTDPKKRINPADQAKARSVVLKRSDFAAGWTKAASSSDDSEPSCPGYKPNFSDLTLTGEAESEFDHDPQGATVSSSAEVYTSKSDALKSWARGATPALPRCLGYIFRKGVEADGDKATILKQGRIAFPKIAPRTIAYRVVTRVTVTRPGEEPVTVPFTMHIVGVGRGRADATLFTGGVGNGVPPASLRAFARILSMRLAKAGF